MRVVLVLGKAQEGKTTLALRLLRRLASRLFVLDPVRARPLTTVAAQPDVQVVTSWAQAVAFLASERASSDSWTLILRSEKDEDYAEAFRCARYYRHVSLFADEGLWHVSSGAIKPHLVKCARANANFGDGIGVPLWITAQRPMDLPPDIRSQSDQCFSFRQDEPNDVQFLAERYSPDFAEGVATLEKHKWLAYPSVEIGFEIGDD